MPEITFTERRPTYIAFTIAGNPSKNKRTRVGKGRLFNSREHEELVRDLDRAWGQPLITSGRWALSITSYMPRLRRLGAMRDLPLGDVDGPISGILDAIAPGPSVRKRLGVAGILDDDARVIRVGARKFYDHNPLVEVELWMVQP